MEKVGVGVFFSVYFGFDFGGVCGLFVVVFIGGSDWFVDLVFLEFDVFVVVVVGGLEYDFFVWLWQLGVVVVWFVLDVDV